ncbi:MAG: rhodanese-like domain-containing protein [Desulfobacterales bacterium]|nr:rhodanese-like domain-containing protein [Desulfobacterales bacterium]
MQKKLTTLIVAGVYLLLVAGLAGAAEWANPDLLITPEALEKNISKPDWVVIDSRDLKDYAKGHIPGAISLGKRVKKALRDPTSRVFSNVSKYEKLLGKAGIDNNTHVVFYHGDIKTLTDASVGFWVMEYLGHDKVHFMDGGLEAWRNSGFRLEKDPTIKEPKTFAANVVASRLATTSEITDIAIGKLTGVQVIDSRSKKEHQGKDIRAIRGGHVPNTTINVSHKDTMLKELDKKTEKMEATGFFDAKTLQEKFASLNKSKRTIGYCQTGTRSTLTYLELRLLGFKDPANWDESWRVYSSDLAANAPVENEQWYNFDGVNKAIKKLNKKVKKLEETIAALEEKKE